jgi:tagatose-6-phosphate ketose/aldose isomerase
VTRRDIADGFRESDWVRSLSTIQPKADELLGRPEAEQYRQGYFHTLREICQQPATLLATCECMMRARDPVKQKLTGIRSLQLTGSGSSEYVGNCVRLPLQNELRLSAQTVGGGAILTHGAKALPPERPALMVSFARSGDSPESVGAVLLLLEREPGISHLIVTCNPNGKLAETFRTNPKVHVIILDERTNDRSLVMTSSFSSLVIAARSLGLLDVPDVYRALCERLSGMVKAVIEDHFGTLARVAAAEFRRAVFLASGVRFGGAREASLKMLEMTAGRVTTLPESYLGLRHGPMSYVHDDALVVCFLSSDPTVRAYETDLIRSLNRKRLGLSKLIVGEDIPTDLLQGEDVAMECAGFHELGDENAVVVDVVVGQVLAFFCCLKEGLHPDSPSQGGVINRVVESFEVHPPGGKPV